MYPYGSHRLLRSLQIRQFPNNRRDNNSRRSKRRAIARNQHLHERDVGEQQHDANCHRKQSGNFKIEQVIMDELGRGTSTSDGFGLAWSIALYLSTSIRCYSLFATHFHEMTQLSNSHKSIQNYFVNAEIKDGQLTMLYRVMKGKVDRSYGLFVAEMLGFP